MSLRDFRLTLNGSKFVAGPTLIEVENRGPTEHETVIERSSVAADKLPLASNGVRLSEDSAALTAVVDFGGVDLDHRVQREVDLVPGHYVVFCNLPGHFLTGMHAEFDVSANVGTS